MFLKHCSRNRMYRSFQNLYTRTSVSLRDYRCNKNCTMQQSLMNIIKHGSRASAKIYKRPVQNCTNVRSFRVGEVKFVPCFQISKMCKIFDTFRCRTLSILIFKDNFFLKV